jgi:type VI secretion system protein ImpF
VQKVDGAKVAKALSNQPLLPSVLDRLVGGESGANSRSQARRGYSVNQLKQAIRRDLEDMLNSYQRVLALPADLSALGRSIFDYGIPDLTDVSLSSTNQIERFRARLEAAILQFDPRFKRIEVKVESVDPTDHTLRFRIDAVVHVYPAEEEIVLHSYLDPATRRFSIPKREA